MSFWTGARERFSKFSSPPDKLRRLFPLVFGLILAGGALFLAAGRVNALKGRIEASTAPTDVVVAAVRIEAGGILSEENLAKARLPASGVGRRHVPASDFQLLVGARAREGLEPGDPVLWSDVDDPMDPPSLAEAVPEGRRAVTLSLDQSSSFSGLLRPGDRVDLLCTGGSGGAKTFLIESVPVIAVGKEIASSTYDNSAPVEAASATLSLTPSQASPLLTAARHGSIQWMLRNETDNGISAPRGRCKVFLTPEIWEGGFLCARRVKS